MPIDPFQVGFTNNRFSNNPVATPGTSSDPWKLQIGVTFTNEPANDTHEFLSLPDAVAGSYVRLLRGWNEGDDVIYVLNEQEGVTLNGQTPPYRAAWTAAAPSDDYVATAPLEFICFTEGEWLTNGAVVPPPG